MASRALDLYYAMRFLKLLATPFEEWKAYELGLIDGKGNLKRKAKTPAEKEASTPFMNIAKNIKRILNKFPGGRVATASLAVGLLLMREQAENDGQDGQLIFEIVTKDLESLGFGECLVEDLSSPIEAGRYELVSPFYDEDIVYVKEAIKIEKYTCFLPVFEVTGHRGKKYLVTSDHLRVI